MTMRHRTIWHRYGDIAPQELNARKHGRSGDFILCPMLYTALDRRPSGAIRPVEWRWSSFA